MSRERKLNTNFFFSNFSGTSGISRQIPGISRQKSLISLVSRDISNFSAPTPSCGRPPPHPKKSGPKSLGLGSFFVPECHVAGCHAFFGRESGPEKGVITKGVFSLEKSLESLKSLDSLESLENGRILLYFPQSGRFSKISRISKFSRISRKWTFLKRPLFQKTPFPNPREGGGEEGRRGRRGDTA